jgi:hypothetical protein
LTASCIENAQSNADSPSDLVPEKKPVARALQKRRQQGDAPEDQQSEFSGSMHPVSSEVARASSA